MKIRKGDTVQVITGNDRGKRGEVTRVLLAKGKVVVRGVNVVKKHQKKSQRNLRSQRTRPAHGPAAADHNVKRQIAHQVSSSMV